MSKYHAVRTGKYASKKEAKRAQELMLLQRCGEITELEEQVIYPLIPKQEGERAASYVCDFRYRNSAGLVVVEDVKGMKTPVYILKRKMMLWKYNIRITES